MEKRRRKSHIVLAGYTMAIIVVLAIAVRYHKMLFMAYAQPEVAQQFIASFGPLGPLVLILAQIFQVVIFIIPGPVMTVAGGFAFGIWWGFVYSFIGTYIGSLSVFWLGRRYGRPFVERFVGKRDINRYDRFIERRGALALLLCRLAPIIIPNDVVSLAASVSKMSWREYALASFIGFIPNILIITLFGDRLANGFGTLGLILLTIVSMTAAAYFLWQPIKGMLRPSKPSE